MTQVRADKDLAFMLQYESVAWYDAGEVRIRDAERGAVYRGGHGHGAGRL